MSLNKYNMLYLKYKTKYNNLKMQMGSGRKEDIQKFYDYLVKNNLLPPQLLEQIKIEIDKEPAYMYGSMTVEEYIETVLKITRVNLNEFYIKFKKSIYEPVNSTFDRFGAFSRFGSSASKGPAASSYGPAPAASSYGPAAYGPGPAAYGPAAGPTLHTNDEDDYWHPSHDSSYQPNSNDDNYGDDNYGDDYDYGDDNGDEDDDNYEDEYYDDNNAGIPYKNKRPPQ